MLVKEDNAEFSNDPFDKALKKLFRDHPEITARGLSNRINNVVSHSYIIFCRQGKRKPSPAIMEAIAKGFDISPFYFLDYRVAVAAEGLKKDPKLLERVLFDLDLIQLRIITFPEPQKTAFKRSA